MTFSPELEQRLAKLMNSYPQGRIRSALIPMLLYCQDEVGHISEELMLECAKRLGCPACRWMRSSDIIRCSTRNRGASITFRSAPM